MTRLLLTLSALLLTAPSWAGNQAYGNATVARVISVYDGDTFRCDVAGWPALIGENISVRVYGIDAPEIRGTKGATHEMALAARELAERLLCGASVVELRDVRRGSFFRVVADVYVDGVRLANVLMAEGVARGYDGETKTAWTTKDPGL